MEGTSVSPQPSKPGLAPAAGAGNSISESAEVTRAAVADAANRVKQAWRTKEFSITLERIRAGEEKMTVWAATQRYRKENYLRVQRLRKVYEESGAHARVKEAVQGSSSAGIRGEDFREAKGEALEEGLAATHEEHITLTGNELRKALEAEDRREAELKLRDKEALNELYVPGTWRCNRCHSALAPTVYHCPNFMKVKSRNKIAKYGTARFAHCKGSQADTWGGYVRGAEIKPPPGRSRRDEYPDWRGKFSGGSRSVRVKAQQILSFEELEGQVPDDPNRAALVARTLQARQKNQRDEGAKEGQDRRC